MRTSVRPFAAGLVLAITSGVGPPASAGYVLSPTVENALELPTVCEGQPRESVPLAPDGGAIALLSAADPVSGPFGVRLLAAVSEQDPGNALVSPLGIGAVLAMVSPGATEPVRRAIGEAIGSGGGGPEGGGSEPAAAGAGGSEQDGDGAGSEPGEGVPDVDPARMLACQLAALRNAEAVDEGVEVQYANGAFADRRLDLFPSFAAALGERFDARVERLDFADESAVARINAWVSEATRDAIPVLVSELEPDDVLVLANAVHFRGEWTNRFDPEHTVPAPFHLRSGTSVDVPTMHATDLPAPVPGGRQFPGHCAPLRQRWLRAGGGAAAGRSRAGRGASAARDGPHMAGRARVPALARLVGPAAPEPGDRGVPASGAAGAGARAGDRRCAGIRGHRGAGADAEPGAPPHDARARRAGNGGRGSDRRGHDHARRRRRAGTVRDAGGPSLRAGGALPADRCGPLRGMGREPRFRLAVGGRTEWQGAAARSRRKGARQ